MDFTTLMTGGSILHHLSYYPQLKKCWETGSTEDLSLQDVPHAATGAALSVVVWLSEKRFGVIVANAVGVALLLGILYFKLRERSAPA